MRFVKKSLPIVVLSSLATQVLSVVAASCDKSGQRIDCGYVGINQGQCESSGCCWSPVNANGIPWCFKQNGPQSVSSYEVSAVSKRPNGMDISLSLKHGTAVYGTDIPNLRVAVDFETKDRVHVKITDASAQRWEVPQSVLPIPSPPAVAQDVLDYDFSFSSAPFGFAVTRISDGQVLFNTTTSRGLVYEDQYLQVSTVLPSNPNIYGFAERIDNMKLDLNKMYTMWSYDIPTPDHQNLYGVHPYYMEIRDGKAHSVFLKNSNAQEVYLESGMLTYHTTGGVLDFYVFVGPTPDLATKQYHKVIGTSHMPPFWSLGWHQCRYGFKNLAEIEGVVKSYHDNGIPLDTIWADIDHMDQYKDFTWDPVNYPQAQVKEFVDKLHSNNQKMVVIVDPGIHNDPSYSPYTKGLEQDVFIKRGNGKDVFIGKVWPGTTAFPDFFHPNSTDYWYSLIKDFLDQTPLDGLWIDMNEISNFCNGYCDGVSDIQDSTPYNNPPYKINNANHYGSLNEKTLDMDSVHYPGDSHSIEYNVHSLFGLMEGIATNAALEKYYGKRSFVLSRSTFPGSGKHVAHWLGDNHSNFKSMRDSFPGAMMFNLLGVPFVGSDICGFMDEATEELCNRWHAVGAFYPFARNHQGIGTSYKFPYTWESVKKTAVKSLSTRYSLLSYYYTLFYHAHVNGGTVMRPLFYEFPQDNNVLSIDQQFMIGSALLFAPCMVEGAKSVNAYFPGAKWYDFWTFAAVPYSGEFQVIDTSSWDAIPLYIRGGNIVPLQTAALTSAETKLSGFNLVIALDASNEATGDLFYDNGEDLNVGAESLYVTFSAAGGVLKVSVERNTWNQVVRVESITVLGLNYFSGSVHIDGNVVSSGVSYDSNTHVLKVTSLNTDLAKLQSVSWSNAVEASIM